MKFVRFSTSALLLTVAVAAHADVPSSGEQRVAKAVKLAHRDRLYDVTGLAGKLFVVGHPGLLLRSEDGGATFTNLAGGQKDEALFSIAFNAKGQGAVVGRSGFVLLSDDKGATWRKTEVVLGEEKPSLFGVDVLDDGTIVAVGEFGAIVRSEDRGKSWTRSPYSIDAPAQTEAEAQSCAGMAADSDNSDVVQEARLTDVSFVDSTRGYVVGEFGLALRTEDGGRSFKRLNSCTDKILYSVSVASPTRALAVGAEGTVIETNDGGGHWRTLPSGTTEHLFGVFADNQHTLVAGAAGTVLTRSGDAQLSEAKTGVHSWLTSAYLDAKGQGLVVGGRANLLSTKDSGKTQTRIFGE